MEEKEQVLDEQQVMDALTTEDDSLAGLTEEEAKVASKILPALAAKANSLAEAKKAKEVAEFIDKLVVEQKEKLKTAIEEIRKSMVPPSPEELQTLLDQDYLEFKLKLGSDKKEFVLCELPLAAETKIVKLLKKTLGEHLKELARIEWSGSKLDRINQIVEAVPSAVETLAGLVAICLNPRGEFDFVTQEWVMLNIGSNRMVNILTAQIEVNRYRDFFSKGSRLFRLQMMA